MSYPPGVTQWHIDYYAGGYDEPLVGGDEGPPEVEEKSSDHLNLPPLFEDDDWLWVAQSLGYVDYGSFEARHRMDRIIARILEYRAEDVRKERGE